MFDNPTFVDPAASFLSAFFNENGQPQLRHHPRLHHDGYQEQSFNIPHRSSVSLVVYIVIESSSTVERQKPAIAVVDALFAFRAFTTFTTATGKLAVIRPWTSNKCPKVLSFSVSLCALYCDFLVFEQSKRSDVIAKAGCFGPMFTFRLYVYSILTSNNTRANDTGAFHIQTLTPLSVIS